MTNEDRNPFTLPLGQPVPTDVSPDVDEPVVGVAGGNVSNHLRDGLLRQDVRTGEVRTGEVRDDNDLMDAEVIDEDVADDDFGSAVDDEPQRRRWTVFVVVALSLLLSVATATALAGVIAMLMFGAEGVRDQANLDAIMKTRAGFLTFVVVPQMSLIVVPCLAAFLSPVPFRRRLSLVRGHWPIKLWIAAAVATPLVGIASGLVVDQFLDESANLKELGDTFRLLGTGAFALVIAVFIGLTPAVCEELLFRGYSQTRLVRSFPPWVGIVVSSLMFAAFHIDPVHAIGVFPLGLYLGLISYRSGSLFPAMLGHFVNNFFGVLMMIWGPEPGSEQATGQGVEEVSIAAGVLGLSTLIAGVIGAIIIFRPLLFPPVPAERE